MKKLELLYAREAWLKSSFDKGRYLLGDEVVGADGKCQWRNPNVRVVGDLVILFTEGAGCVAVCRVVQDTALQDTLRHKPPAQGPFVVFENGVFQSSHLSMQSAEASAKRGAWKSPGAVYTIYRPFRTIKGRLL